MNGIERKMSFLSKLSMTAAVLLLTQQALAAGTTAGTDINNLATVDYFVNGNDQEDIESAPGAGNSNPGAGNGTATTFVVDNRVDFSLTQVGDVHTVVSPGATDAFVEFTLTNEGNSVQDFRLVATQLNQGDGLVFNLDDSNDDIANVRVRVGNGGGAPTTGSDDWVDELGENQSVTIYVYGDADVLLGLVDGDVMNLELTATVAEGGSAGGGGPGDDLVDDAGNPDDPTAIDIVFADGPGGLGDGVESDRHGFKVESAGLTVTKEATIISDPFNGTSDPKAIPGAIIEYVITVANSGTLDADNVAITDDLDGNLTLITGFYAGGDDLLVQNDGTQITPCIADADATDGCSLVAGTLTIGNGTVPITVVQSTSLVVTYRVTIQ